MSVCQEGPRDGPGPGARSLRRTPVVAGAATAVRIAPGVGLLRSYERADLRHDLPAALGLWALLIPQGLAYAQLAGMPPVTGLYTGVVAAAAYALFGTSRYLNMGPDS